MIRVPTRRAPTHPGEMLLEEFLIPMDLTRRGLADSIRVPYRKINELAKGRRGITPSIALRLGKFFGMSADFWMNLQVRWDLYQAQRIEQHDLNKIQPLPSVAIDNHIKTFKNPQDLIDTLKKPW